jgi:hypothetical protein
MESRALRSIREGITSNLWLSEALQEVEEGHYPLSELRAALEEGLEAETTAYRVRATKVSHQVPYQGKAEAALEALRAGKPVTYKGVTIPAP